MYYLLSFIATAWAYYDVTCYTKLNNPIEKNSLKNPLEVNNNVFSLYAFQCLNSVQQ